MTSTYLVIPGQIITEKEGDEEGGGFLRGHGTYVEQTLGALSANKNAAPSSDAMEMMDYRNNEDNDEDDDDSDMEVDNVNKVPQRLVASVTGVVERVNKLISVVPASPTTYVPAIGDLVVGRIVSVGSNRWKVRLNPYQREAVLLLSGVNLPNGAQRIKTSEDALAMRKLFSEGDLVSAEVQQVMHDGSASLHTRSLRYGKLENGCVVCVPPSLIPRLKQHFETLNLSNASVDVLLGNNGHIWIQRSPPKEWSNTEEEHDLPLAETLQKVRRMHITTPLLPDERLAICRVRNSIEALRLMHCRIVPDTIIAVYEKSLSDGIEPKHMLEGETVVEITAPTRKGRS